jgi:hypothetical protein
MSDEVQGLVVDNGSGVLFFFFSLFSFKQFPSPFTFPPISCILFTEIYPLDALQGCARLGFLVMMRHAQCFTQLLAIRALFR